MNTWIYWTNTIAMYRNNDFIYDAAIQLENLIAVPVTVESARLEYDTVLTIKSHQFTVTAKSDGIHSS